MRFLQGPLGGPPLVQDYLDGADRAVSRFRGPPSRLATFRDRAAELEDSVEPAAIARVAPMIRPVGPAAEQALSAVARQRGYFVTTGQQPGLFGGALYSLYKALTAVQLARTLTMALGRPVMPLFWVASEDHDWEEANHAHVIDQSNQLRRLTLGRGSAPARRALGRTALGEGVRDVVAELTACFPQNDFHARYTGLIREAFRPAATMAEAFSELMTDLLGDTPVGLVDAANPALKQASRPVLRAEAEDPSASETAVRASCEALKRGGYALQVPHIPGAVNLFVDSVEGRDRLHHSGSGSFALRRSGRAIPQRELLAMIDDEPERVSPNVLLRPVVESSVFPTLAYVGGPGEIAYFAQLSGLFRRHGVGMPVVVPRASLLAVEAKVTRVLDKFGLEVDELREGDALLGRFALDQVPPDVGGVITRWRNSVESLAVELMGAAMAIDPVLKGAVTKTRNSGMSALAALEKKVVRAVKRHNETTWSQIAKARVHLWPANKPQDRILGPLQYAMRYGSHFVSMALDDIRVDMVAEKP